MRSVKVSDGTWEELTLLKLKLRVRSYDEVIKYLLNTTVKTSSNTSKQGVVIKSEATTEPKEGKTINTIYLEEYVRSEVVPKLKKYIYGKDKVKLIWDLNELRKLLESITNIPPDDVIEVLADLGIIEVKNNQATIKTTEETQNKPQKP